MLGLNARKKFNVLSQMLLKVHFSLKKGICSVIMIKKNENNVLSIERWKDLIRVKKKLEKLEN